MLDIKFIRQNKDLVKKGCEKKQINPSIVNELLAVDKKRLEFLQALDEMRAQKNKTTSEISAAKDEQEKRKLILRMQELDINSDRLTKNFKEFDRKFKELNLKIPNLPLEDVPIGKSDKENIVLKTVGAKPSFDFKFKDYLEIAQTMDLIDTERGGKVAGSRFSYLKGKLVLLEFAIINFVFEKLIKKGFIPLLPPIMLKEEIARGTGYFEGADKKEAYYIPEDNLYLIGTAEQAILGMHADEVFSEKELPKRYIGFSSCFRREAGSYGKDTRGILRSHQFDKMEMFSFCSSETSSKELEFFLANEEELMQELNIPYQVIKICTGDLGFPAAKKYDIEAWIPSENRYRETHSTSSCTDFQARRLNIRFKKKDGKLNFVHTVNGTAFAMGRILIAIIENYQQKDGSIKIPEVLQKYLGFAEINNL